MFNKYLATPHISPLPPYGIDRRYNRRSPPYIPPLIQSTKFSGGLTAIQLILGAPMLASAEGVVC